MKRKSKKQIAKRMKQFRYHKVNVINAKGTKYAIWHPAYVFIQKGNVYIYVTITHSNNIKDVLVVKLRKNPNPEDKRVSYYVAEVKEDTKDQFGRHHKDRHMDEQDDADIRKIYKKR